MFLVEGRSKSGAGLPTFANVTTFSVTNSAAVAVADIYVLFLLVLILAEGRTDTTENLENSDNIFPGVP